MKKITESQKVKVLKKYINEVQREMLKEDYYSNELNRLKLDSIYSPKVQISDSEGNKTKTLDVNLESIPVLITWLKKVAKLKSQAQK